MTSTIVSPEMQRLRPLIAANPQAGLQRFVHGGVIRLRLVSCVVMVGAVLLLIITKSVWPDSGLMLALAMVVAVAAMVVTLVKGIMISRAASRRYRLVEVVFAEQPRGNETQLTPTFVEYVISTVLDREAIAAK